MGLRHPVSDTFISYDQLENPCATLTAFGCKYVLWKCIYVCRYIIVSMDYETIFMLWVYNMKMYVYAALLEEVAVCRAGVYRIMKIIIIYIRKWKHMYVNPNVWMYMIFSLRMCSTTQWRCSRCVGTFQHNNVYVCKRKYFYVLLWILSGMGTRYREIHQTTNLDS